MVATSLPTKPKTAHILPLDECESESVYETGQEPCQCCKKELCFAVARLVVVTTLLAFFSLLLSGQILFFVFGMDSTDTDIQMSFERPPVVTFPAITVCNNNGIQKSKFCEKYPHHCNKNWDNVTDIVNLGRYYELLNRLPLEEIITLGQKSQDFIPKCLRRQEEMEPGECNEATPLYGPFYSNLNCFTFLTGNEVLTGNYKTALFAMTLNFQPEENVERVEPVGGKLFFHDQTKKIPDDFPLSTYKLKPGVRYTFLLKQTNYYRMPPPYTSGCKRYDDDSEHHSQQECRTRCLRMIYLDDCGCIPDFIPWFEIQNEKKCPHTKEIRDCQKRIQFYSELKCDTECPVSCKEVKYEVSVVADETPNYNKYYSEANKQLANVRIQFETNEQITYYEIPSIWYLNNSNLQFYIACLNSLVVLVLFVQAVKAMVAVYRACKSRK